MTEIPSIEPDEILAGDTLSWIRSLPDYLPDDGYTLKYRIINSANKYEITASADGDAHLVSVSAAVSATYASGTYEIVAYVERGSGPTIERYTLTRSTITIRPSIATQSAGLDTRTHVKRVLDAIEAAIEGRASRTDLSYTINGRTIQHIPHTELIIMRDKYKAEYVRELKAERIKQGLNGGGNVLVRFS